MNLSEHGAAMLVEYEGFSARPYRDSAGVWTVGFGSTRGVGPDTPAVTRDQALQRMRREVDEVYGLAVNDLALPLTQHRFDALAVFAYNVGVGALSADARVGRRLRARDWRGAARAMLDWDKARDPKTGRLVRLEGLARRRRAEAALLLEPQAGPLEGYTPSEARWIREYDRLVRDGRGQARRAELRAAMRAQRKRVWRAAQSGGWTPNRLRRYASLLARSG
jgi:lysozyme